MTSTCRLFVEFGSFCAFGTCILYCCTREYSTEGESARMRVRGGNAVLVPGDGDA